MRLPIPIENSYDSTRVGADEQRRVNMYRHSRRGWRQFPGLTEFTTLAIANTLPTHNEDLEGATYPGGTAAESGSLYVKDDGTKLYIVEATNSDVIEEYDLSTPFSLATISGDAAGARNFTFTHSTPSVTGFTWGDSGSRLYVLELSTVRSYTASTPYQTTTLTDDSKVLSPLAIGCKAIAFNATGTRMFLLLTRSTNRVVQYSLSTAWDITTATYDVKQLDYTAEVGSGEMVSMACDPDLGIITMSSGTGDDNLIHQYSLGQFGDLETATYNGSFDGTAHVGSPIAMSWANAGTYLYTSGQVNNASTDNLSEWATQRPYFMSGVTSSLILMDDTVYGIYQGWLYKISAVGTVTSIGSVGVGATSVETDGVQLVITTGKTIYVYTVAGGLVTVTDPDVEDTAKSSAYLDLAFYFDQDLGNFIASANNDATSFSADDKIEAESFADDILRMFAHNQLLYSFGQTTTEIFYTSGVGRPPIDRQQVIERGIAGTRAVASIDDTIFFVDQFRRPNKMSGLQYEPIYTPAIAEAWDAYTSISDCLVMTYSYRQQTFVEFQFPSADTSWTYHVESGAWSERESAANGRFRSVAYVNAYGLLLAADPTNGKVYKLSESIYQDDGSNITRTFDTGLISSDIYGDANVLGNDMICNSLKITTDCTAAATLTVSLSKDGGAFAQSRTMTLTEGLQTRELNAWGKFREGIFRITTTSNAGVDIVDISADLEVLDVT